MRYHIPRPRYPHHDAYPKHMIPAMVTVPHRVARNFTGYSYASAFARTEEHYVSEPSQSSSLPFFFFFFFFFSFFFLS